MSHAQRRDNPATDTMLYTVCTSHLLVTILLIRLFLYLRLLNCFSSSSQESSSSSTSSELLFLLVLDFSYFFLWSVKYLQIVARFEEPVAMRKNINVNKLSIIIRLSLIRNVHVTEIPLPMLIRSHRTP